MLVPQLVEQSRVITVPVSANILAGQGLFQFQSFGGFSVNGLIGIAQQDLAPKSYYEQSPRTILVATKGYLAVRAISYLSNSPGNVLAFVNGLAGASPIPGASRIANFYGKQLRIDAVTVGGDGLPYVMVYF